MGWRKEGHVIVLLTHMHSLGSTSTDCLVHIQLGGGLCSPVTSALPDLGAVDEKASLSAVQYSAPGFSTVYSIPSTAVAEFLDPCCLSFPPL